MAPGRKKTGGRKAGTPNKATTELKTVILSALDAAGGVAYLAQQAHANPGPFLQLVGKVLPLTLTGDARAPLVVRTLSDEQLLTRLAEAARELQGDAADRRHTH
jgi:hypothetical protein